LGCKQADVVHIISHCPYLLAQYFKYPGKDISSTIIALLDLGFKEKDLLPYIRKFPTVLTASADRLYGWFALLQSYNIAKDKCARLLERSPFMFYINAPSVFEVEHMDLVKKESLWNAMERRKRNDDSDNGKDGSSESSEGRTDIEEFEREIVWYEVVQVLEMLKHFGIPFADKLIRSQPAILLESAAEIRERYLALLNFYFGITPENLEYCSTNLDLSYSSPEPSVIPKKIYVPKNERSSSNSESGSSSSIVDFFYRDQNLDYEDPVTISRDLESQKRHQDNFKTEKAVQQFHKLLESHPTIFSVSYE
jgi:hypothetical protein